jgi:uncharacterized protein
MAKFEISVMHPEKRDERKITYDSSNSTLIWDNGEPVIKDALVQQPTGSLRRIEKSKKDLKKIKIQLGLSCNFECEYCSQRFVPHADSTNPNDVEPFVNNMASWYEGGDDGLGGGSTFEFWGGEPLVYWKTLKPLAEAINKKYPKAAFTIITNGSLFDAEKIDWLDKYNFLVGISHDGPGQPVRGPDPLDDPKSKEAIIEIFRRFAPKQRVSFNAMINSKNYSRIAIQMFFEKFVIDNLGEEYLQYLSIGEGGFVDAYDEGGVANSLGNEDEEVRYRNHSLNELREGKVTRFDNVNKKVFDFIATIEQGNLSESLGQKCGMDSSQNIAVDLNGNVLTCQNVSAVSTNPSGISHHVGHVSDLSSVDLKTSTHWRDREECPNCPVVHLCKGACMFLTGDLWETSCNNAFSDNIVAFTLAIETITNGYIPGYIDGPLREDRKDIYWWINGKPATARKNKKFIPIVAV